MNTGAEVVGKSKEKQEGSYTSKGALNREESTTWLHECHYGKNVEGEVDKVTNKNKESDVAEEKNECLPLLGDVEVIDIFLQMNSKKGVSNVQDRKKEEHTQVRNQVHDDTVKTCHRVTTVHVQRHVGAKGETKQATTHNEKGKEGDLHQNKLQTKPLTGMKDRRQVSTTTFALNEENKLSMEKKKKKEEVQEDKGEKAKEGDIKKKNSQGNDADILGTSQFDLLEEQSKAYLKEVCTGKDFEDARGGQKKWVKRNVEEIYEAPENGELCETLCDGPRSNSSACTHSSGKKKKINNMSTARSNKENTDNGEIRMCLLTNAKERSVDVEEKIPHTKSTLYLTVDVTCANPAETFSRQKRKESRKEVEQTDEKECQVDQIYTNQKEKKREQHSMINDKRDGGGDGDTYINGNVSVNSSCHGDGEKSRTKQTKHNQLNRKNDFTITPSKCADMQESAQRPITKVTKVMEEQSCHKKRKIINGIPLALEGTTHTSHLLSGEIQGEKGFFSTEDESPPCHIYSPRNVSAQIGTIQKDDTPFGSSGNTSSSDTPSEDEGERSKNGSEMAEEDMVNDPLVRSTFGNVLPNKEQVKNFILSVEKTCNGEKEKKKKLQKRKTSLECTQRRQVTKRNSFLDGLSPDESLMEDNNEDCKEDTFCDLPFFYDSQIIYKSEERNYGDSGSYRQSLNPSGEIAFSLNNDDLFDEAERDTEDRYTKCASGKNEENIFEEVEEERGDDNKLCQSDGTNQYKHGKYEPNPFINFAQKQMNGEIVNYRNECPPILECVPDGYTNVSTERSHQMMELSDQNPFSIGENVKSTFMEYVVRNSLNVTIDSSFINDKESVKKKYGLQINGFKIVQKIDALYQRKETNQNPSSSSESSLLEICDGNESFVGSYGTVKELPPLYGDNSFQVNHFLHKGDEDSPVDNYDQMAKKEDTLFQNDHIEDIAHIKTRIMNVCGMDEDDNKEDDHVVDDVSNCDDRFAKKVKDEQPLADLSNRTEARSGLINDDCSQGDETHVENTGGFPQGGGVILENHSICMEKEKQIDDGVVNNVTLAARKDSEGSGKKTLRSHPADEFSGFSMLCSKGKKTTMHEDEASATLDFEEIYAVDDLTMCPENELIACTSLEQPEDLEKKETDNHSRSSLISTDGKTEGEKVPSQKCTEEDESGIATLDVPSGDLPSGILFQFVTRGSSDGSLSEEQEEEGVDHTKEAQMGSNKVEGDQMKDDLAAVHAPEGEEGTTPGNPKDGDEVEGTKPIEESTEQIEPVQEAGLLKGQENKTAKGGAHSESHPISHLDEGSSLEYNEWSVVEGKVIGGGVPTLDIAKMDATSVDVPIEDKLDDAELTCNGTSSESVLQKEAQGESGRRERDGVPTLRVRNEKDVLINETATPPGDDNLPLEGEDEENKVPLHAKHRVEAEKLNQDIPYITNIHKEMHRSPVMPLRIEAFHSLEDQRLIHGRPEWQKYMCPLCDKVYYTPNSYIKNYAHYLNEHWKKRKILGGYIIFPCKLIHNEQEEKEEKDKPYLRISKKMRKKKRKKLFTDPHYHCPICLNVHFTEYVLLTEHCVKMHKSSGADPSRTLPSDVVHTPFINSNDYYCTLKKFESEKNITIDAENKCINNARSTIDSASANLLGSTITSASLEKGPNQSEQKNKGKHRRSSRVIFCDEIQVREYDIELSRIEKFGASIGPVFTEENEQGIKPNTVSEAGGCLELVDNLAKGEQNGMLSGEVETKDEELQEEGTSPEQGNKWAMDKEDEKDKPMKKCNKDISSNVEDIHVEGKSHQNGSANVKHSVHVPESEAKKKDGQRNTPVVSSTERKIIESRKKKKQDGDANGNYAPSRKNLNAGHRKGVSNKLHETPLPNGKKTKRNNDDMDIYTKEKIGESKSRGEKQSNEEANITSSFKNCQSELINEEKKGEKIVNQMEDSPSMNHANIEKNQTEDESGTKKIDEGNSADTSTQECIDPGGNVKVETDPPRSDSLNELISSLFIIDNNSPPSRSEHKSVPVSCLMYEENLQIKEQALNEILLENRIENSKENIFIPVKKKMGKRMQNGTENIHKQIISKYKRKIKICTLNEQKKEGKSFFDFKNYENVYMPPKNVSLDLPPEKETHILKKVIRPKKKEKIPSLHLNCRQSARIKNRNKLTQ
eukprot:XP_002259751.1 hypothetical protein, conserved in Plasmodium species [Plasmodium knowlesi strain H]